MRVHSDLNFFTIRTVRFIGHGMARQLIGRGEEKAFERQRLRKNIADERGIACGFHEFIGGHKMAGFEVVRDIVESLAFADGEGNFINFALGELPENVAARCRGC